MISKLGKFLPFYLLLPIGFHEDRTWVSKIHFSFKSNCRSSPEEITLFPLMAVSIGINFIQKLLSLVLAVFKHLKSFYCMCRRALFNMINDLPTVFEIVTGAAKKQLNEKSVISNHSGSKMKSSSKSVSINILHRFDSLTIMPCILQWCLRYCQYRLTT